MRPIRWQIVLAVASVVLLGAMCACTTDDSVRSMRESLSITEDFRDEFMHGEKGSSYQKYIVLHDSEGKGTAAELVDWWSGNGGYVASHFVVNKDGSIVQCVPLDSIAHHAGFGDTGHNVLFGVEDESRDDRRGTIPLGDWASDYGMNSYSVGISMVHLGEEDEEYPEAQLEAVDGLIAYIDAYYGFESEIIEHREWRTRDCASCSPEFAPYLKSYKTSRTHAAVEGEVHE